VQTVPAAPSEDKEDKEVEDDIPLEHNTWPSPEEREEVLHVSRSPTEASIPDRMMKKGYSQEAIFQLS